MARPRIHDRVIIMRVYNDLLAKTKEDNLCSHLDRRYYWQKVSDILLSEHNHRVTPENVRKIITHEINRQKTLVNSEIIRLYGVHKNDPFVSVVKAISNTTCTSVGYVEKVIKTGTCLPSKY